jgi:tetratricopeptide (TPR) repeat protein
MSTEKTIEEMRNDPDFISLHDADGAEVFIQKEEWRTNVLPGTLEENWNDPNDLYSVIVTALHDGFHADLEEAVGQLVKIDPMLSRSACIRAVVLMENSHFDEAERVLSTHIDDHGEEGVVLTNLAKIYDERGDEELCEETLWRGLKLDPNQENAVQWWLAIANDRGGENAVLEALTELSALPGSWRAHLWMASDALQSENYDKARSYYDHVVSELDPLPPEVMTHISGDLGNAGRLSELVELFGPRFDPQLHGLGLGNNLMRAYVELEDLDAARGVLQRLHSVGSVAWSEALAYWDDELKIEGPRNNVRETLPDQPSDDDDHEMPVNQSRSPHRRGLLFPGLIAVGTILMSVRLFSLDHTQISLVIAVTGLLLAAAAFFMDKPPANNS